MEQFLVGVLLWLGARASGSDDNKKDYDLALRNHRKLEWDSEYSSEEDVLPDEFIILFDKTSSDEEDLIYQSIKLAGGEVQHVYKHVFKGVAVSMGPSQILKILDDAPILSATPNQKIQGEMNTAQLNPPWGLDRIDEDSFPLDSTYTSLFDGTGVTVFVLDTGIRLSHVEFEGRASCALNLVKTELCSDLHSHGTHVASIIGGKTFGVAKNVTLEAVKVLSRSGAGTVATIIAAVDYIISRKVASPLTPMVMNLSLGGKRVQLLNEAVAAAVKAGVVAVVSAGNSAQSACKHSPASSRKAITVGATSYHGMFPPTDRLADFSNIGKCVDIFAPGENIPGAAVGTDYAIGTFSGTSQAAPHVAGAAALYLHHNPSWTPDEVWKAMKRQALVDKVLWLFSNETANRFLNIQEIGS